MPRFALKVEYCGQPYAGWQRQTTVLAVQEVIESALSKLQTNPPTVTAAGRTDAGVHALGQVAHVDMDREWDPFRLSEAINFHLKPQPIAITACVLVAEDWHARFSAIERRYMYRTVVRRAPLVLGTGQVWRVVRPLDIAAMEQGAAHLIGKHDFTTFRSTMCQAKSPIKTLDEITFEQRPYSAGVEICAHLRARSFLHNQVRSIVGTLERVGMGAWPPDRVAEALAAKDRAACGPVAPPDGLYLMGVSYPSEVFHG